MTTRRFPWLARALLRQIATGPFAESLEGDLAEQWAAGRSTLWYWQQVAAAALATARRVARRDLPAALAAALFFLVALTFIAPATHPLMEWARTQESLRIVVLAGWLVGIPLLLGGIAGSVERRRVGAILLAATLVYLTPVTAPFGLAACDLCARPAGTSPLQWLTPLASALLAGAGARIAAAVHPMPHPRRQS